ncbi:unnamed protein product [Aphis gossypii]|uniref:Uncharacterized protein n=1 Tax=Aphis gossypii TaxID=80765 RepID=A0A9P0NI51_APHGO|nr:unnamed protein product [Aphis gossypii]
MTEATSSSTMAVAAAAAAAAAAVVGNSAMGVVRRGWGALVLGTNQYLTGGKRTDGKKAAWQPSAIPHRLILCCARTCFSSSSIPIRVLYCFILLHRRVSSSLFGRPALTQAPCAPSTVVYKCSAPTEIFTQKTIV